MFTNNAQFPYISVIAAANIYILSCMENLVVSEAGVSGATALPEGSEQKTLRPQPTGVGAAAPSAMLWKRQLPRLQPMGTATRASG